MTPERWKVLVALDLSPYPDVLEPVGRMAQIVHVPPDREALRTGLADAEAYLASLHVRLTADLIATAPKLRVIATPSTGTDHIDLHEAASRGIEVLSLKNDTDFLKNVTATAELAWALLLTVVRRLPEAMSAARAGDWARERFRGHQLSGKTFGVLGYGRLGRIVAEYAAAFRMRVLACDVRLVDPSPDVEMVSFDTLLAESDVLSIHVHLDDSTRGLIDRAALAAMKPRAVLINTSRGAIVDEGALMDALESGRLAGAGLDVIDGEWSTTLAEHPLLAYSRTRPNLVVTPHIGGITYESQAAAFDWTIRKLARFIEANQA